MSRTWPEMWRDDAEHMETDLLVQRVNLLLDNNVDIHFTINRVCFEVVGHVHNMDDEEVRDVLCEYGKTSLLERPTKPELRDRAWRRGMMVKLHYQTPPARNGGVVQLAFIERGSNFFNELEKFVRANMPEVNGGMIPDG